MSEHETDFKGDVLAAVRLAIEARLPGAVAHVKGGGGHYTIEVTSALFAGKSKLVRKSDHRERPNRRIVNAQIGHREHAAA